MLVLARRKENTWSRSLREEAVKYGGLPEQSYGGRWLFHLALRLVLLLRASSSLFALAARYSSASSVVVREVRACVRACACVVWVWVYRVRCAS